jgi:DNA-binding transcriptional MerR regulator
LDKAPEAFRTISEVAEELDVPKHVLRFWEGKFAQLKPMKRGGGRRYYRPEDVALLRGIRVLLYNSGYTIKGVQKILRENGPRFVMEHRPSTGEEEEGGSMPRPQDIPDIAGEAALSRVSAPTGGQGREGKAGSRSGSKSDRDALGAVLQEIEACYRILATTKE